MPINHVKHNIKEDAQSYNWIMFIGSLMGVVFSAFSLQFALTLADKEALTSLDIVKIVVAILNPIGTYIFGFFTNQKK